MKYHYMVVEGPHDAAAVGRILELLGASQIKRLRTLARLDVKEYLLNLARLEFPYKDDLTERMPVPLFYRFGDEFDLQLFAVHAAGGESALVKTMAATLSNLDDNGEGFTSLAILGDTDERSPIDALNYYKQKLNSVEKLPAPMQHFADFVAPGKVLERGQRVGVYVMPDNQKIGTLETVLLECATDSYHDMKSKAEKYVESFLPIYGSDWSIFKKNKAVVGCMNNLLRPGTSNTVSIAKDEWFCATTMSYSGASGIQFFIKQLLGLEPCSIESATS